MKNFSLKTRPEIIVVVSNRGSALNWTPKQYLDFIEHSKFFEGKKISFLSQDKMDSDTEKRLKSYEVVSGFESIKDLIVWLSKADKVMSSSTGPLHIAHAAGVPVLGLFPPNEKKYLTQSFMRWRPAGFWHQSPVEFFTM